MLSKSKKTSRLFLLSLLTAIMVTSVDLLDGQIANAGRPENSRQLKTDKVSPSLKADRHNAGKTVTVIVTLTCSARVRGNQDGRSYSLSQCHQPRSCNVCCNTHHRRTLDIYTLHERMFRSNLRYSFLRSFLV